MPSFVHIFIGNEFSSLIEGVGRAAHKYSGGTTASDISYLKVGYSGNNINISRLVVCSTVDDPVLGCLDRYLKVEWEAPKSAPDAFAASEFATKWKGLYDELFTINNSGTFFGLTVVVHFPFYKPEAYDVFEKLYVGIKALNKPTRINFMGYFDDLVGVVEPSYKIVSPSKNQIAKYSKFRAEQQMDMSSMLIVLQNATFNGVSLGLTEEGLKEVVSQFVVAAALFYQDLFPTTLAYKDVIAFGISSLQVDKYLLVDYLMNRAFCNAMDVASVNSSEVDVNEAFDVADRLLCDKHQLLSTLFSHNLGDDGAVRAHFHDEVESIMTTCEEIFKREKSITKKAAILAALLSKTDCTLFSDSIYKDQAVGVRNLFAESLDYFIKNDYGEYLYSDGKPMFNPINELRLLDAKIINSENEIRRLSNEVETLGKQIADAENVERCYFDADNRIFHFNDNEFRIQPDNIEPQILEENFVPVSVSALPESVDLRSRFNPVRNQGQQNSCVAFSLTSIYEYMVYRKTNELHHLSEAFLYYNARDVDSYGDVNVDMDDGSRSNCAIESLRDFGLPLESLCPYNDKVYNQRPDEMAYENGKKRLLIKAFNVERKVEIFKAALAEGYPIDGGFLLCDSFFTKASIDGYVPMPSESELSAALNPASGERRQHGRHEMAIVGYSDKLQCFIVRNSWGSEWGDGGYCYMPYTYVEDCRMMDFAAIITEIKTDDAGVAPADETQDKQHNQESQDGQQQCQDGKDNQQQSVEQVHYDVPTLTMNDDDIRMRYYITQALLSKEGVSLRGFYARRDKLVREFENMTRTLASRPANRDEYINSALDVLNNEFNQLKSEKRELEQAMEEDSKAMKSYNLKVTLCCVGVVVGTYVLKYIWNQLFVRGIFEDPAWIDRLSIGGWLPLLIIFGAITFLAYRAYGRWIDYRELVDANRKRLVDIDQRSAENRRTVADFKGKTFAAWHLLREVARLESHLNTLYTKYLSLINNLRAWYIEVKHKNSNVTLEKSTPNISLLDHKLADKLFNDVLCNDKVSEIDFTSDIDKYSLAENYIVEYKRVLGDMVAAKLLQHPAIADFNLTEHIVHEQQDWVREVNNALATKCEDNSNIFVHLSRVAAPNMERTEYLITKDATRYDSRLRSRFTVYTDGLNWDNAHMLSCISIMPLRFEDCDAAQQ